MGEKGNMMDPAGFGGIGSGVVTAGDISGGVMDSGDAMDSGGSGHHESGMMGSVAKAAAEHAKAEQITAVGDESVSKSSGLAGLLPSAEDEKPPTQR
jgi:hypothetical protein